MNQSELESIRKSLRWAVENKFSGAARQCFLQDLQNVFAYISKLKSDNAILQSKLRFRNKEGQ